MVGSQVRHPLPLSLNIPAFLTPSQTLLPPSHTTSPPRSHVRLRRQGASASRPTCPRVFTTPCTRIVVRLLLLPSPRWSSAKKTTRWSMSSTSISPPPLPPPRTLSVCSELDSSFFLVTVDLWSADGKREMNLVLHPSSSTDRHVSTVSAKPKKPRGSIPSATSPRSDHPSPPSSHSTPNSAPDPHRPSLDSQVCITRSPQININLSVSQL